MNCAKFTTLDNGIEAMEKKKVLEFFGGHRKVCEALGISVQYVYQWPEKVPQGMAYKIESVTQGALKVEKENYK